MNSNITFALLLLAIFVSVYLINTHVIENFKETFDENDRVNPNVDYSCTSISKKYKNALGLPQEFLFKNNSYYTGVTDISKNSRYPNGAKFKEVLQVLNSNQSQKMYIFSQDMSDTNKSYSIQYTLTDSLLGKQMFRNTTGGNGWMLMMTGRKRLPDNKIQEIYDGEGNNEYLPEDIGTVKLRLVRTLSENEMQVNHKTYYKVCNATKKAWDLVSSTDYVFATKSE